MEAKLTPDIILLDFQMPTTNGLEAAKRILARDPSKPVVMYTLHDSLWFEREAKAIGVRAVISKSDVFLVLLPTLDAMLGSASH